MHKYEVCSLSVCLVSRRVKSDCRHN